MAADKHRLSPWRVLAWAFALFLVVTMLHLVVTNW